MLHLQLFVPHSLGFCPSMPAFAQELLGHLTRDDYQRLYLLDSKTLANLMYATARAFQPTSNFEAPKALLTGLMPVSEGRPSSSW